MRNISNDLSTEIRQFPEVEVLLATYNGECYIGKFLESLVGQEEVRIHLRVSDDGSTDKTLEIVGQFADFFESCEVFHGPGVGPSANFFFLIDRATYDFVALADQDDIWEKDKLATQISNILGSGPQLICHDRSVINGLDRETIHSQITVQHLDLGNALIENVVYGNTILLNKAGVNLIQNFKSSNAIMYDSYLYLIFSCLGTAVFIQKPLTRYRIHNGNMIGIPGNYKRLRNFRSNIMSMYQQNRIFFDFHADKLNQSNIEVFRKYFLIFEGRSRIFRTLCTLRAPIRRQRNYQTLVWKLLVIVHIRRSLDPDNRKRKSSI